MKKKSIAIKSRAKKELEDIYLDIVENLSKIIIQKEIVEERNVVKTFSYELHKRI